VNAADSNPPATPSESQERKIVWLLCLLAAGHVLFFFSAAAPFFNNVDEQIHLDRRSSITGTHPLLEPVSRGGALRHIVRLPEYVGIPAITPAANFPRHRGRSLWKKSAGPGRKNGGWRAVTNYEAAQPPLYYTLAPCGGVGKGVRISRRPLLYWLRFLNISSLSRWSGWVIGGAIVFPEREFLRLGVPALLAFIPQSAFYSIQTTSCRRWHLARRSFCWCGCCARKFRASGSEHSPSALAATFLTKISNLPLLAVSGWWCCQKLDVWPGQANCAPRTIAGGAGIVRGLADDYLAGVVQAHLRRFHGTRQNSISQLDAQTVRRMVAASDFHAARFMDLCVGPHGNVLAGEFSGIASRWRRRLWTRFTQFHPSVSSEWPSLPCFPFHGYDRSTAAGALVRLLEFHCAVVFLGSCPSFTIFTTAFYPSGAHPYFTSGRLMLGALIPFSLLYLYGLDCALSRVKNNGSVAGVGRHDFVHADFGNTH